MCVFTLCTISGNVVLLPGSENESEYDSDAEGKSHHSRISSFSSLLP